MKLNYITIMVRNLSDSLKFYKELAGLKELRKIELPHGNIVFLANNEGETMLELIEMPDSEKVQTKGMVISFTVEDELETVHDKALAFGYKPSDIIEHAPKPKHFTVKDPDEMIIEFSK